MSDQQVLKTMAGQEPPPAVGFERWSIDRIRAGLLDADAQTRIAALAMAVDPARPNDSIVAELARCAGLSKGDEGALIAAATALNFVQSEKAKKEAGDVLAVLANPVMPKGTRSMAANGFWLFKRVPTAAWPHVANMLFSDDNTMRTVAHAAALPHANEGASAIAAEASRVGVAGWTPEGLDVLAASAGSSAQRRTQVEDYITKSLSTARELPAIVSVSIAAYAALARLQPNGAGLKGLLTIAESTATLDERKKAIAAIARLGDGAKSAVKPLTSLLERSDEPEIEEAICHALMPLGVGERDVPLKRTLERVEHGPDQSVVAHCMLLALHAKPFAKAAPLIARKIDSANEALKPMLDAVYEMMTGRKYLVASPVVDATNAQEVASK